MNYTNIRFSYRRKRKHKRIKNKIGIATTTRNDITDTVTQNLRVTGVGTFVAGLDLNGNVTIGNAHTDILTINSRTGVNKT